MPKKSYPNPHKLMEKAIEVMKQSISEPRSDGNTTPKVGAVLLKPDGTVETACRGELRYGDHAEFTLIERKNRENALDDCVLFATLEPCAPGARNPPKLSCAERIVNARIKDVWVGCQDPHPKVAGKGIQFLQDNGVSVHFFPRALQEEIEAENKEFFRQARLAAEKAEQPEYLSDFEDANSFLTMKDLSFKVMADYQIKLMGDSKQGEAAYHQRLRSQGLFAEKDGELRPTGYGVVLFANHPGDPFPQARIMGTIFKDDGEDIRDFDGPMLLAPDQAVQWIKDKLPNPISRAEVYRREKNEGYYELIREGLVNAIVHRNYELKGAKIQLRVTPDKVEIHSPGEPMAPVTLEQMKSFDAPMYSRNPPLHAAFSTMELAEERGMGLQSMRERAQQDRLPLPTYSWKEPYLILTVYRDIEGVMEGDAETALGKLGRKESTGWAFIVSKGIVTQSEYASAVGVTERTAQRHLNHFIDLGLLTRLGSGPTTKYQAKLP